MGLFAPWFLAAGVIAAGLPLWLHLLRKHRSQPLPFSSLMFFEQRTQSSIKHRRLRYLVLFILRTLLLLLIAFAFAHPYIEQKILPFSHNGEVAVLAIDNSLSMRAAGRFDQAKQMARSAISGLRSGQRAEVLEFGARVHPLSEVTDDTRELNAAIDAAQPSDDRTSFAELARSLRSIAQALKLPLKVELFSDMQQSGMPGNFNDLRLNAAVQIEPHPLASKETPNWSVENIIAPRRVYDGAKQRVLVTVASYGAPKSTRQVSLVLNDRVVETKPVEVPESGRGTVEFQSLEVPYGRNKGVVKIDSADTLPADDAFNFSVERADPKPALFVYEAGGQNSLLYFKAALEAGGQSAFSIQPVQAEQTSNISPSKYAFVVLSDVSSIPANFENELRNYVHAGGSVLVALGHNALTKMKVPVSDDVVSEARYSGREGQRFQVAAWLDPSYPAIQKNGNWEGVKFYRAVKIVPGKARVVARLSDDTPLLVDQQLGEGHIEVFTSTFDNIDNDFPLHKAFVPFIDQTARYLGRLDAGPPAVQVGSFEELREAKQKGEAVDVVDPKGQRVFDLREATTVQNVQFTMAGFYDIRRPNGRNELVAVNSDRRESDLTPAAPDTLKLWQNTASETANGETAQVTEQQKPISLWWYVMLAALALAIAESLLGNRHLSVDKEAA
ncbi:MAG TPA: BatA and WFA domain-containing protein [Bryobacteraceae bacterium]|nr:BatA and WFA domain-containing protein [Bryobacteraceae bacterium]